MDTYQIIGASITTFFVVLFGFVYALWPINDEDTSALHRALSFLVTAAIVAWVWGVV